MTYQNTAADFHAMDASRMIDKSALYQVMDKLAYEFVNDDKDYYANLSSEER